MVYVLTAFFYDNTHKHTQPDGLSGSSYLVSVHEGLAVAGSPPGNVGQRLALSHAGDHGGAALHGCHIFQLGDMGLDWRPQRMKRGEKDTENEQGGMETEKVQKTVYSQTHRGGKMKSLPRSQHRA